MKQTKTQHLGLFSEKELEGIQSSGSAWVVSDNDPATVPVPLQTVIMKVDGPYTERDRKLGLTGPNVYIWPVERINVDFLLG